MNNEQQNKVIALFLVSLIIGLSGALLFQQSQLNYFHAELNEVINANDAPDWGATITMSVYRSDVLLSEETHHNLIPDAARSALRGHIADSALAEWNYIAIGTSTGGGTGSTTLEAEYSRYQGEYAVVGSFNFTLIFTWTAGNFSGQTIVEYGIFNDPTTGTILSYADNFSRGPLTAEDALKVTVNFQIDS